jgi:hypothetical protein
LMIPVASAAAQTPVIRVHKDPNYGCRTGWVRHIQAAGFSVTVREDANLQNIRKRLGVPAAATGGSKAQNPLRKVPKFSKCCYTGQITKATLRHAHDFWPLRFRSGSRRIVSR